MPHSTQIVDRVISDRVASHCKRRPFQSTYTIGLPDTPCFFHYSEEEAIEGGQAITLLQIPDDQATALQTKAAAEGLTLEAWLRRLAGLDEPRSRKISYSLAELVAQCDATSPLTEEDRAWMAAPSVGNEAL